MSKIIGIDLGTTNSAMAVLEGGEPTISFDEFLRRMKTEKYDPDHIYEVWAKMAESPEMRSRMEKNVETGVCERGYTERSGR